MHYSTIVAAAFVAIAAAAPSSFGVRDGLTSAGGHIQPISADESPESTVDRRDGLTSAGGRIQAITPDDLQESAVDRRDGLSGADGSMPAIPADTLQVLSKRGSRVTHCGGRKDTQKSGWIPVADNAQQGWIGYMSAVKAFCYHATHSLDGLDTVIGPGLEYTDEIMGVTLTSGAKGHVNFVIQNKMKQGSHTIKEDSCISYLSNVAGEKSSCYGKRNKDTKGGTYYVDGTGDYKSMPGTGEN